MAITGKDDWRGPGHTKMDINEVEAIRRYERLMDRVYFEYFYHPTNLRHHELTEAEEAEYSEMTGVGHWAALGCPMK